MENPSVRVVVHVNEILVVEMGNMFFDEEATLFPPGGYR
jgi:hypothetical protein